MSKAWLGQAGSGLVWHGKARLGLAWRGLARLGMERETRIFWFLFIIQRGEKND